MQFSSTGKVFLFGDLNSRIGNKLDYIADNRPIPEHDFVETDCGIPRAFTDKGTNKYGDLLIDMCKSTSMRIVNGRCGSDCGIGKTTCFTHNGESTVDFLLTNQENFSLLYDFKIHDFNIFSNHAPVQFDFAIGDTTVAYSGEILCHRWNNEYRDNFVSDIADDIDSLCCNLDSCIVNNDDTDVFVSIFTEYLTSKGNVYFEKNVENGSEIDVQQFYMHFKALSSEISVENDPICENCIDEFDKRTKGLSTLSTCDSLDVPFTTNEIRQAIKSLGKNKSCSTDNVIYEYYTEGIDVLDKPLVILFNYILEKQSFPKSWSKGVIIPIHKKGRDFEPKQL